jgi:hypothetical protein
MEVTNEIFSFRKETVLGIKSTSKLSRRQQTYLFFSLKEQSHGMDILNRDMEIKSISKLIREAARGTFS